MIRFFPLVLALLCWVFTITEAHAIGSDHPKGSVASDYGWPAGVKELVNRQDRVHGYWINDTHVFFYNGDSKAFNQFMDGYSKLKNIALYVVIHPGTKTAGSPWDQAERDIPVVWSLHASTVPLDEFGVHNGSGRFYTRVDVWLGSRVKLEELRIPASVEVASGGEIEKFIAEHQGQKKR